MIKYNDFFFKYLNYIHSTTGYGHNVIINIYILIYIVLLSDILIHFTLWDKLNDAAYYIFIIKTKYNHNLLYIFDIILNRREKNWLDLSKKFMCQQIVVKNRIKNVFNMYLF